MERLQISIRKRYILFQIFLQLKTLLTRENPPTQKSIAKSLNISVATINKVINQDLTLKTIKKHNLHQLLSRMRLNAEHFIEPR